LLLDRGANIEHQSKRGLTALFVAVKCNHFETIQVLLNRGANIKHQMKFGMSVLVAATCWILVQSLSNQRMMD
jgi:ankyrin repeat protein